MAQDSYVPVSYLTGSTERISGGMYRMGVVIYAASRFTNKKNTVANKMDSATLEMMFKKIEAIKQEKKSKS